MPKDVVFSCLFCRLWSEHLQHLLDPVMCCLSSSGWRRGQALRLKLLPLMVMLTSLTLILNYSALERCLASYANELLLMKVFWRAPCQCTLQLGFQALIACRYPLSACVSDSSCSNLCVDLGVYVWQQLDLLRLHAMQTVTSRVLVHQIIVLKACWVFLRKWLSIGQAGPIAW